MIFQQLIKQLDKSIWQAVTSLPGNLTDKSVDVVLFSHTQTSDTTQHFHHLLDDAEKYRATQFYTESLQNQFIIRRAMLRYILSAYIACHPQEITLAYAEHGKPFIADNPVFFNLSHSLDLVIVVITKTPATGIDIEFAKPIPDMERVARHHFSPAEQERLFALPSDEQMAAFYRCWTRKEAFIKADGRGLGIALDSFDVSLLPSEPAKLIRLRDDKTVSSRWQMRDIPLPGDYTGAIIAASQTFTLNCFVINPISIQSP